MSLVRFRFTNFRYVLAFARWNFGIGKNRSLPTTLIRSEHPFRGKINVTIAVFFSKFDLVLISHGIEQRGNSGYGNASLLGNQRSRKPYSTFCRERTVGKLFFNPLFDDPRATRIDYFSPSKSDDMKRFMGGGVTTGT